MSDDYTEHYSYKERGCLLNPETGLAVTCKIDGFGKTFILNKKFSTTNLLKAVNQDDGRH